MIVSLFLTVAETPVEFIKFPSALKASYGNSLKGTEGDLETLLELLLLDAKKHSWDCIKEQL